MTVPDLLLEHSYEYDSDCGVSYGCACDAEGTESREAWAAHVADILATVADARPAPVEPLVGRGGLTGTEFVITAWHIEDGRVVADEKVTADEYAESRRPAPVVSGEALAKAWDQGAEFGYRFGRDDERMEHAYARPTANPYRTVADAPAAEPERLALDALFPGTREALAALTINPQGER